MSAIASIGSLGHGYGEVWLLAFKNKPGTFILAIIGFVIVAVITRVVCHASHVQVCKAHPGALLTVLEVSPA